MSVVQMLIMRFGVPVRPNNFTLFKIQHVLGHDISFIHLGLQMVREMNTPCTYINRRVQCFFLICVLVFEVLQQVSSTTIPGINDLHASAGSVV